MGGVGLHILRALFQERVCVALVRLSGEPTFPWSGAVLKWSSKRQLFLCYNTRN